MKILFPVITTAFLFFISCTQEKNRDAINKNFEIYETVSQNTLPLYIREKIAQSNIIIETDTLSSIIGYIQEFDSVEQIFHDDEIKLLPTKYPVNKEKDFYALVAVKNIPSLNNSDVKNTKPNLCNVEIYFNFSGAKKWAELTKKSIGNMVAISVDGKIYDLPKINNEIRNGAAIINGLEDKETAIEISNSINK